MRSTSILWRKSRGFVLTGVLSSTLVLDARLAHGDVDAFGAKLPDVTHYTFAISLPVPIVVAARAGSSSASGFVAAGALETRVHFGHHGFLLGVGFVPRSEASVSSSGSPPVGSFDVAYSFADFSNRRMRGFGGAVSFDIGPSIGLVGSTYEPVAAQNAMTNSPVLDVASHATIGARVSAHADLFIGPVMLGVVVGYRGGIPTNASSHDNWEGLFFFNVEIGGAFVRVR